MNVASGVLSELMSAKMDNFKRTFWNVYEHNGTFQTSKYRMGFISKVKSNYNPQFFAAQIQISIPNKSLGFGYKGLAWK